MNNTTLTFMNGGLHDLTAETFTPDIYLIAQNLSHVNRWTGNTPVPFSVAQHSLLVSYLVPPRFALEALLHDATEAYLGDIAAPLKELLPEYKRLEKAHQSVISAEFGVPEVMNPDVKYCDNLSQRIENTFLRNRIECDADKYSEVWESLPAYGEETRRAFLRRFKELYL